MNIAKCRFLPLIVLSFVVLSSVVPARAESGADQSGREAGSGDRGKGDRVKGDRMKGDRAKGGSSGETANGGRGSGERASADRPESPQHLDAELIQALAAELKAIHERQERLEKMCSGAPGQGATDKSSTDAHINELRSQIERIDGETERLTAPREAGRQNGKR